MTSSQPDLEARVAAAVRTIADEPQIVRPPLPIRRERRVARGLQRWAPAAAALGVLVMILLVAGVPWGSGGGPTTAAPASKPLLPETFAGMSLVTAKLSDAPLKQRAIAVVSQGNLGTTWGTVQKVVVGADGRTYRRIDLAESRGAQGADAEWHNAQTLLSADGTQIAVGDERGGATEIPLLDLVTGERHDVKLARPSAYRLMGWSPEGTKLAVTVRDVAAREAEVFDGDEEDGRLMVVDVSTGSWQDLGVYQNWWAPVAFSADGTRLMVQNYVDQSWHLDAIEVSSGRTVASTNLPRDWSITGYAPDLGGAVVIQAGDDDTRLQVMRLPDGTPAGREISLGRSADPVAWRSAGTLVLFSTSHAGRSPELIELDVDTGAVRVLATFEEPLLGGVNSVALASDLLADAGTTDAQPERGPWPVGIRIAIGVLLGGIAVVAVRSWRRARA
ncbi:MAG: hypothetical protein HOV79_25720 [Hamadaea sp.]|nr:hypothetical protein [Hamadaea sp.]